MKNFGSLLAILMFLLTQFSCSDNDDEQMSVLCDRLVMIDDDMFQNRSDDDGTSGNAYQILNAEINGDCLLITIQSGGCNGESWKVDLVDAGRVAETFIEQRDLKVFLDNEEQCNAIVTRTISFEITSLRTNSTEITLNLDRWPYRKNGRKCSLDNSSIYS